MTEAERRQKAIASLADAYIKSGQHRDYDTAKIAAEKAITDRATKNSSNTTLRLGKTDADFFDGAASELLSEFNTKKAPKLNSRKSVTGKSRLQSKTTKDGQYSAKGIWQEESDAEKLDGEAAEAVGGTGAQSAIGSGSSVPPTMVDNVNTNNANNAQNSQKTKQTEEIVENAKNALDGVPGALTGSGESEEDNSSGNGSSGGGGGNNTTEEKKVPQRYYSVWDAYWKGAFGEPGSREAKGAAAYYTVDAIAKYFKNLSKGIGNIGAQFSGGTVDTSDDTPSEWQKAMNVMNEEQREKWGEQQGSQRSRNARAQEADITTKQLSNSILNTRSKVKQFMLQMFSNAQTDFEKKFWADAIDGRTDIAGTIMNMTGLEAAKWAHGQIYGNEK